MGEEFLCFQKYLHVIFQVLLRQQEGEDGVQHQEVCGQTGIALSQYRVQVGQADRAVRTPVD
jgi:hypothetical protein